MTDNPKNQRTIDAQHSMAAKSPADAGAKPTLRYLRRRHVLSEYPICPRTLSYWQQRRVVPYVKVGRTVLFRREDIEAALERYRIAAIGE